MQSKSPVFLGVLTHTHTRTHQWCWSLYRVVIVAVVLLLPRLYYCHVIPPPTPTATATTVGDTIDGLQGAEGCSLVPWLGEKVWNNSSPIMLTMVSLNVWTISATFFQVTHGHSKVATILMQQVLGMGNFVQKLKIERLRKTTSLRTNV